MNAKSYPNNDLINETSNHLSESLSLSELLDINVFQDLSNSFFRLTGLPTAILDLNGNILIASGWQKICNYETEKANLIKKLQEALSEVKQLSGLLPICASCKKIRDDKGYWNQIESYIKKHSEAEFSHCMCPDCSEKYYGQQKWYTELKKESD